MLSTDTIYFTLPLGTHKSFFELEAFRVIVEKREGDKIPISEATIRVRVNGELKYTAAMGDGPVNALDQAFRDALVDFYPDLKEVKLIDYKVRILNDKQGTGAKTRVLIESADDHSRWGTVGVSENIIEASWQALVDSIEYKLLKEEEKSATATVANKVVVVKKKHPVKEEGDDFTVERDEEYIPSQKEATPAYN